MKSRVLLRVAVLALVVSGLSPIPTASADDAVGAHLTSIEKGLWEAWKNHDTAPFKENLAEGTINITAAGVEMGKAELVESTASSDCDVKSYSLSEIRVHRFGDHTAILTYRASQDGVCGGQKLPAAVNVSSVYVKDGDKWLAACYHESPAAE